MLLLHLPQRLICSPSFPKHTLTGRYTSPVSFALQLTFFFCLPLIFIFIHLFFFPTLSCLPLSSLFIQLFNSCPKSSTLSVSPLHLRQNLTPLLFSPSFPSRTSLFGYSATPLSYISLHQHVSRGNLTQLLSCSYVSGSSYRLAPSCCVATPLRIQLPPLASPCQLRHTKDQ